MEQAFEQWWEQYNRDGMVWKRDSHHQVAKAAYLAGAEAQRRIDAAYIRAQGTILVNGEPIYYIDDEDIYAIERQS